MVVSVTLSRGVIRLAKLQMIVKRQTAIQDLGSMDVLCTDKTRTLTEAKIRLEHHITISGQTSTRVLELAYLNSFFETGLKNPLDEAILSAPCMDVRAWQKIDEIPFDFERRCVCVLVDNGTPCWRVAQSANEDIVHLCTHVEVGQAPGIALRAMDDARAQEIHSCYRTLERDGLRVVGVAWRAFARGATRLRASHTRC